MEGLVKRLGFGASILVIAVTPAVLEETIFRGLLQGRLMALFGRFGGLFVTASAFAIVHGAPAVLPIHLSIGLYLGWLRPDAGAGEPVACTNRDLRGLAGPSGQRPPTTSPSAPGPCCSPRSGSSSAACGCPSSCSCGSASG
jgi:hypothetical protein